MTVYMPRAVYPLFKRLVRGRVWSAYQLDKHRWLWRVRLVRER